MIIRSAAFGGFPSGFSNLLRRFLDMELKRIGRNMIRRRTHVSVRAGGNRSEKDPGLSDVNRGRFAVVVELVSLLLLSASFSCGVPALCRSTTPSDLLIDKLADSGINCAGTAIPARDSLTRLGTSAFDCLIPSIDDNRKACPCFQNQTSSATTVGEVCLEIISAQVERYSYVKSGPRYLTAQNVVKWWSQNRDNTLIELQVLALKWTIEQIQKDKQYMHLREHHLAELSEVLDQLVRLEPERPSPQQDH